MKLHSHHQRNPGQIDHLLGLDPQNVLGACFECSYYKDTLDDPNFN